MEKSFEIYDIPQRTPQWFSVRRGKLTASNFAKAVKNTSFQKSERPESLAEKIKKKPFFVNTPFEEKNLTELERERINHGIQTEPVARSHYESLIQANGEKVLEIGFVASNKYPKTGCSPDGIIIDEKTQKWKRLLEIKCPKFYPKNHPRFNYLTDIFEIPKITDFIYADYYFQIQGSLHILGLPSADYLVYASDFVGLFRIDYDEVFCQMLFEEIEKFFEEFEIEYLDKVSR